MVTVFKFNHHSISFWEISKQSFHPSAWSLFFYDKKANNKAYFNDIFILF